MQSSGSGSDSDSDHGSDSDCDSDSDSGYEGHGHGGRRVVKRHGGKKFGGPKYGGRSSYHRALVADLIGSEAAADAMLDVVDGLATVADEHRELGAYKRRSYKKKSSKKYKVSIRGRGVNGHWFSPVRRPAIDACGHSSLTSYALSESMRTTEARLGLGL